MIKSGNFYKYINTKQINASVWQDEPEQIEDKMVKDTLMIFRWIRVGLIR